MISYPTSFRFTEDIKKKLSYICLIDKNNGATEISTLIEDRANTCLNEQLKSIVTGENKNLINDLVYLLNNKFISREYFLYSLSVPPKVRTLVLEQLKEND